MKNIEIRRLTADEIEVYPAEVTPKFVKLVLYKNARCDQAILDEAVGAYNWQRKHSRDNANCTVSIWDSDKKMWIEKEDTGSESDIEMNKGLASDSFKRACTNWGIGRELYTMPVIYFPREECNVTDESCSDTFSVTEVEYDGPLHKFTRVVVRNNYTGSSYVSYAGGKPWEAEKISGNPTEEANQTKPSEKVPVPSPTKASEVLVQTAHIETLKREIERTGIGENTLLQRYKKATLEEMTIDDFNKAMKAFEKTPSLPKSN